VEAQSLLDIETGPDPILEEVGVLQKSPSPQKCAPSIPVRGKPNHHIRFVSEDSDTSDFSDSVRDCEGGEQRLLKIRQRNRKKKNLGSLEKKKVVAAVEGQVLGSSKLGRKENRRYEISALHRRAVSFQDGCVEEGSDVDETVARSLEDGGRPCCPEFRGGSGISVLSTNQQRRMMSKTASVRFYRSSKNRVSFRQGVMNLINF